jgi:cell division protein FtsZ
MDDTSDFGEPKVMLTPQATGISPCVIKVIGVGGGGGNTLNRMVSEGAEVERSAFLEYVACNTDVQALTASFADSAIQLGKTQARGLGAGGIPAVGRASAIDAAPEIEALVRGVDMVFVTAGMGGGTGSGAAPVVAELAKQAGALTVGIVTKPFSFEGKRRRDQAALAIEELQQHVDILIVVSNDKLLEIVPEGVPLQEAFSMADEILRQGITGISDIVVKPGLINVDFADVRSVMTDAGPALMGIGRGFGKTRARDAALAAVSSPLLDFPIEKAKGVVFTITGNSGMSLQEVNEVAGVISNIVSEDANIIFGTSVDETYQDEIAVTVVATSFEVPDPATSTSAATFAPQPSSNSNAAQWPAPAVADPNQPREKRRRKFWGQF